MDEKRGFQHNREQLDPLKIRKQRPIYKHMFLVQLFLLLSDYQATYFQNIRN
ncbi:hypothetical protein ES703_122396 [subsurface metagenome]